jgi:ABC-type glycerol-3-phosphate transport system substrate-binding protein
MLLSTYIPVFAAPGQTLDQKVNGDYQEEVNLTDDIYYTDYMKSGAQKGYKDYTGSDIALDIAEGTLSPQGNFLKDSVESSSKKSKKAIVWNNNTLKSIEWETEISQAGYYNIEVDYLSVTGSTTAPQREFYLDGRKAYKEMNIFSFPRVWEDNGKVWKNALKDQVRPKQKEVIEWNSVRLNDSQGKYAEPLRFYLSAGKHKVKMVYANEPIIISQVKLVAPKAYKSYKEVQEEYKKAGYQYATQSKLVEGETAKYKSDPSLRIQSDSDPSMQPPSKGSIVYNSIGGKVWNRGNQAISWDIDVPESGIYKLSFRMTQKFTDGLPVYRQVAIDGEVPYKELLEYKIKYNKDGWAYTDLNDDNGNPYEIYLEKGVRRITLTNKVGGYSQIISTLEKDAYNLGNLIQKIIKVTTIDPDVNFDYEIEKKIPTVMEDLKALSASLGNQVNAIQKLSEKRPSAVNNLLMIQSQINGMIKDPYIIARSLKGLMDGQSTMATWISDFQNSPLQIDYFKIQPVKTKTVDYKSNFFQRAGVAFNSFFVSFFKDYDALSQNNPGESNAKTLNLWISRAKEWAEVLQYMTDEEFTQKSGININMNVVPANAFTSNGVIMLAIAAGNAPDLALGVSASVPFEYGIRDAIYDLSQFDDYKSIEKRFLPGIMIPFKNGEEVYALPETMDFSVLFYRTDILNSLKIEVPKTWGDLYSRVLPILKKNGMDFFYDGAVSNVAGAVSAAFHSLLYQHGGSYYTKDGLKSALDTPQAFTAFKQFTDLYTIYGMPVSANLYSRFRAGTMPLGVSSFNTYIQLTAAAPEISGKWDVAPLPGIEQADGKINRSYGGSTTAAIILEGSKLKQESWEFLKWYTDKETQIRYSNDIVSTVGAEARWCSANIEAFDNLSWETNLKQVIKEQRDWYVDMPNVIGGYITPRYVENARVRVVVQNKQYRDSLEKAVKEINTELVNKNNEFAMREKKAEGAK